MNDDEQIQENLRNLPKHSLNSEQKQKILLRLKERQKPSKKKVYLLPLMVALSSLALFGFLVIQEFNGDNQNAINTYEQNLLDTTAQEGKKFILSDTKQEVIGVEENVALLNTFDQFVAKDKRRVAKLMIFYWGNPSELVGKTYRVEAKKSNGEEITLSEGKLNTALNNEDAHALTSFAPFPTEGTWQLSFYIEESLHGTFTINVLPPFPNTEHYTLMESPQELKIEKKTNISIESSLGRKEEVEVQLVNKQGEVVDENRFAQITMHYDAATNEPIYIFSGELTFPKQGTWTLIIDGEKTQPFKN